jgi:hypothetical protein
MTTNTGRYPTVTGLNTGYVVDDNGISEIGGHSYSYSQGGWSRSSVNTPGYYKGFRSGKKNVTPVDLPMNAFSFSKDRIVHSLAETQYEVVNLTANTYYLKVERGCFQEGLIYPSRSASDFVTLDKTAASRMLSGLKDQSVNLGVAVAEGRKSLDLIAKTATNLANAGFAVKKFDFAGAARALGVPFTRKAKKHMRPSNSVASNWLELQYGWLPLLSDIKGAAEFVAKTSNYHPRSRYSTSSTKTDGYSRTYENYPRMLTDQWSTSHTVKYVIYFSEQGGGNPPVALGLTNPLAIAWELVPFSFIVDWFLPVGTFLNNLDATSGLVFVKGCRTEFWRGQASRRVGSKEYVYSNPSVKESFRANHKTVWEGIMCERVKLLGFPRSPVPEFKNPLSGRKGDFTHEINSLALLSQAFR